MMIEEFLRARLEADEDTALTHLGRLMPATDGCGVQSADTTYHWRVLTDCEMIRNAIDLAFEEEHERDVTNCGHSAVAIRAGECATKPESIEVLRVAALRYSGHADHDTAWAGDITPGP